MKCQPFALQTITLDGYAASHQVVRERKADVRCPGHQVALLTATSQSALTYIEPDMAHSIKLKAMPAVAESTTTTSGGARQTRSRTNPVPATAKSAGLCTALVQTGL